jgi:hypothetical protein
LSKYKINNRIRSGYKIIENNHNKTSFWHCWIETDKVIDIAVDVVKSLFPDIRLTLQESKEYLTSILPLNTNRIDIGTTDEKIIIQSNKDLLRLYKCNPSDFWNMKIYQMIPTIDKQDWYNMCAFRNEILNTI